MEGRDRTDRERFEEFLARQDRVRELARRLLGDEAEVEDVVQEAYVAYLSKPAEEIRNVGTWLYSVVNNLCRRVIRQRVQENRTVRGDGNGMESPMPTPDQVAQMEATRHRVLDEVFRLPEAYGTVVWLRYFQGLEPYEIAQRLNILGPTVRSRLNRGVELLRARLVRDEEEGHDTLLPGLLLLAGARPTAPPPPVPPARPELPAPVGAAPGWSASVGLGAAVLIAGGLVLVASGPIASESPTSDAGAYRLAEPPAEALAAAPSATERRAIGPGDASVGAPPRGDWIVRGRVVLGQDPFRPERPLDEGRVRLSLFEGAEARDEPLLEAELDCDERGRFCFDLPDPGRTVTVRLETDLQGHFPAREELVVGRGARLSKDVVLRAFAADATVSGRVVDADGRPVGRAYVHGPGGAVLTDFDGSFRLPASTQDTLRLDAWAAGHGYRRASFGPTDPARALGVELRLAREVVVRGRVVDERGDPVAGARLASFRCPKYVRAETDPDGTFELAGLDADARTEPYTVRAPGFATLTRVHVRGESAEVALTLLRGARLEGTVADVDGRPLAGARLTVQRERGDEGSTTAYSDDDGRFALEGLAQDLGPASLIVLHGDRFVCTASVSLDDPRTAALHLRAEPTRSVTGRVVDPEGRPVAGAFVGVQLGELWRATTERPTDADGAFALHEVPIQTLRLVVVLRGVVQHARTVDVGALVGPIELPVGEPSRLALRVVDGRTGAALPEFDVRLEPAAPAVGALDATWMRGVRAVAGPDGLWRSPEDLVLPAGGAVDVIVAAPGFASRRVEGVLVPGPFDERALPVALLPGLELRARVVTPLGGPVEGAAVAWRPVPDGREPAGPWRSLGSTAWDGAFALAEAVTEPVQVAVLHAGGAVVSPALDPALGEHRIVLAPGGRLLVEPAGAGQVFVRGAGGAVEGLHRSVAEGSGPLPPGEYDVVLRVRELERLVVRVRVDAERARRVSLRSDGDAALDVSVLGRSPPAGLSARLVRLDPVGDLDVVALAEPVVDGRAHLARVPAGRWRLEVTGEDPRRGIPLAGVLELALAPGEHRSAAVSVEAPR